MNLNAISLADKADCRLTKLYEDLITKYSKFHVISKQNTGYILIKNLGYTVNKK